MIFPHRVFFCNFLSQVFFWIILRQKWNKNEKNTEKNLCRFFYDAFFYYSILVKEARYWEIKFDKKFYCIIDALEEYGIEYYSLLKDSNHVY